jgi:hypothetical protein
MRNGKAIETATMGKEGAFGAAATFGLYKSQVRAISTTAAVIPAATMRRHGETSKALQLMCLRSNENLLAQARVIAACNALHLIEELFAGGCCRPAR